MNKQTTHTLVAIGNHGEPYLLEIQTPSCRFVARSADGNLHGRVKYFHVDKPALTLQLKDSNQCAFVHLAKMGTVSPKFPIKEKSAEITLVMHREYMKQIRHEQPAS